MCKEDSHSHPSVCNMCGFNTYNDIIKGINTEFKF